MDKYLIHRKWNNDSFEIEVKDTFSTINSVGCVKCLKRIHNGTTYVIFRIEEENKNIFFYYCMDCVATLNDTLQKILNKSTMEDILK